MGEAAEKLPESGAGEQGLPTRPRLVVNNERPAQKFSLDEYYNNIDQRRESARKEQFSDSVSRFREKVSDQSPEKAAEMERNYARQLARKRNERRQTDFNKGNLIKGQGAHLPGGAQVNDQWKKAKNVASSLTPMGAVGMARSVSMTDVVPFILALSVAVFLDIADLIIGWIPVVATVIAFMSGTIIYGLFRMIDQNNEYESLREKLKNYRMHRRIAIVAGTSAEGLFLGLNYFPIETAAVLLAYYFVLLERKIAQADARKFGKDEREAERLARS